jgi:hypothetical protein
MPRTKSILTPAKQFVRKNQNSIKLISIIIFVLFITYWMILLLTPKAQIPAEYKLELDILNKANADLAAKQKQIDSIIAIYKNQVDSVDLVIRSLDIKKTEVNNYYQTLGTQVNKYTPTQIDSFFKLRYNY